MSWWFWFSICQENKMLIFRDFTCVFVMSLSMVAKIQNQFNYPWKDEETNKICETRTHAHRDVCYSTFKRKATQIYATAAMNLNKISVKKGQMFHVSYHKELCRRFLQIENSLVLFLSIWIFSMRIFH